MTGYEGRAGWPARPLGALSCHVGANADTPELDVLFVGDFDEERGVLGTKGLGELTATSVAPAIANAVHHATGTRVREVPITAKKPLEVGAIVERLRTWYG